MQNTYNYRYKLFLLIVLLTLINNIDRGALSYAGGLIIPEYGLDNKDWGDILGFFGYGYVLGGVVGGVLSDRFGPKKIWLIAALAWSIFEILTAWVGEIGMMFFGGSVVLGFAVVRILFGISEGPVYTLHSKTFSNWAAPKERGFVVSMGLLSTPLGAMLTAPIAVFLLSVSGDWRWMFVILGFTGLIALYFLMRVMTDLPSQNPKVSKEELALIQEKEAFVEEKTSSSEEAMPLKRDYKWYDFFKSRTLVLNTIGYFAFNYVNFLLLTWTPKYLQDTFNYDLSSLWYMGMIPWVGACFTILLGGKISDMLYKKTGNLRIARGYFAAVLMLLTTLSLLSVSLATSAALVIAIIAIGNALNSFANTVYWTIVIDTSPREKVGTFSGVMHFFVSSASVIAPTLTGILVSNWGYNAMFIAAGCVTSVGMICMLLVKPGKL